MDHQVPYTYTLHTPQMRKQLRLPDSTEGLDSKPGCNRQCCGRAGMTLTLALLQQQGMSHGWTETTGMMMPLSGALAPSHFSFQGSCCADIPVRIGLGCYTMYSEGTCGTRSGTGPRWSLHSHCIALSAHGSSTSTTVHQTVMHCAQDLRHQSCQSPVLLLESPQPYRAVQSYSRT